MGGGHARQCSRKRDKYAPGWWKGSEEDVGACLAWWVGDKDEDGVPWGAQGMVDNCWKDNSNWGSEHCARTCCLEEHGMCPDLADSWKVEWEPSRVKACLAWWLDEDWGAGKDAMKCVYNNGWGNKHCAHTCCHMKQRLEECAKPGCAEWGCAQPGCAEYRVNTSTAAESQAPADNEASASSALDLGGGAVQMSDAGLVVSGARTRWASCETAGGGHSCGRLTLPLRCAREGALEVEASLLALDPAKARSLSVELGAAQALEWPLGAGRPGYRRVAAPALRAAPGLHLLRVTGRGDGTVLEAGSIIKELRMVGDSPCVFVEFELA